MLQSEVEGCIYIHPTTNSSAARQCLRSETRGAPFSTWIVPESQVFSPSIINQVNLTYSFQKSQIQPAHVDRSDLVDLKEVFFSLARRLKREVPLIAKEKHIFPLPTAGTWGAQPRDPQHGRTVSLGLSQHRLHGSVEDASACDCSVVDLSLAGVAAGLQHGALAQADGGTCSPGLSPGICCGATDWTLWPIHKRGSQKAPMGTNSSTHQNTNCQLAGKPHKISSLPQTEG